MYDVAVIGSGIGGLTCAALLSSRGKKVVVFEQSQRIGGCCSSFELDGHVFDYGAIFVLFREVYERFFEMLGLPMEKYLEFRLLDPVYDMRFSDGESIILPMDPVEAAPVIEKIAPEDRKGWLDFCRTMKLIWEATKCLTDAPFPPLEKFGTGAHYIKQFTSLKLMRAIPAIIGAVITNQDRVNRRYFKSEKALTVVSFENLFAGIPADRINGLFAVMSYLSHEGYWYPKGGMGAIPEALARIAKESGAEIKTGSKVTRIITYGGRAVGVELENGEQVGAHVILSNASAMQTYLDLVGRENLPYSFARSIENYTLSIPAPMMYLALSEKPSEVRCHFTVMVPPPKQLNAYWDEYYAQGLMPPVFDLPHGLICPSMTYPDMSPPGKFSMAFLSAGPYRLKYGNWDKLRGSFIAEVISYLGRNFSAWIPTTVEKSHLRSPEDFERELLLPQGSIYGLEMSLPNLGPFRPSWRSPVIENLYLAGSSTNPGGGVPLVMLSGIHSSGCIVRDKRW